MNEKKKKKASSTRTRKKWTIEEVNLLRELASQYGMCKGAEIASERLKVPKSKCYHKLSNMRATGDIQIPTPITRKKSTFEILQRNVKENPNNLTEAFRLTAEETGLTPNTISTYWYTKGSPLHRDKMGTCFMVLGGSKTTINQKNCCQDSMISIFRKAVKRWIIKTLHITRADL